MKAIKITLLFLVFCFSALAKDSTTVEFKRFAFGIHASPDYSYRNLYSLIHSTEFYDDSETPMCGYTGGIDLTFFIKKYFAVSLGADFSQKGYSTKTREFAYPTSGIVKSKSRYNYNYIGIPVKAYFIVGKKKIKFFASIGVTSAFMLYQQTKFKVEYIDGTKATNKSKPNYIYKPFNLFINNSLGMDCTLGKKIGLRIEPTYCYGIFDTGRSVRYTETVWSTGLNIGCYIKF